MSTRYKFTYKGQEVNLSSDFDNGALAKIQEVDPNTFDIWPYEENEYQGGFIKMKPVDLDRSEPDSANFCFHFCVSNCKNKQLIFRFHLKEREKASDVSVVYANPDFPVYSYDGKDWQRMERKELSDDSAKNGWQIITTTQRFREDKAYVAYQYPYSLDHLENYLGTIRESPFLKIENAGETTEGRLIPQVQITDEKFPIGKKKVAWFTGLQHCTELGAGWGLEGMIDFLLSDHSIAGKAREQYIFKIIPIVNVDAVSEGRGRIHRTGRNLNREWEKTDPVMEVVMIKKTMNDWMAKGNPVDVFIDFHGFSVVQDQNWVFPVLPMETYNGKKVLQYKYLIETIKKYIPFASFSEQVSQGLVSGAVGREFGALAMASDGYVYQWPEKGKTPDLSSYYQNASKVWELDEIKACGANMIKALVEFAHS